MFVIKWSMALFLLHICGRIFFIYFFFLSILFSIPFMHTNLFEVFGAYVLLCTYTAQYVGVKGIRQKCLNDFDVFLTVQKLCYRLVQHSNGAANAARCDLFKCVQRTRKKRSDDSK